MFSRVRWVQCEGYLGERDAMRKKALDALLWLWHCFGESGMSAWYPRAAAIPFFQME